MPRHSRSSGLKVRRTLIALLLLAAIAFWFWFVTFYEGPGFAGMRVVPR